MIIDQDLVTVLDSLGVTDERAAIYGALWNGGPQTISELSRSSGIERTKVYRLLPELSEVGLIEVDSEYAHDIISLAPLENLQDMLRQQQDTLQHAQRQLPVVIARQLERRRENSRVNVFRGSSGIKQLLWNETRATSEVLSVLEEPIQSKTNSAFFERWVAKCNQKGLKFRGVVGDEFYTAFNKWYGTHVNERLANWQGRQIDSSLFKTDQNMVIYDDVVAYFVWNDKDVFGVEIHNPAIASVQRQFFELLWASARL